MRANEPTDQASRWSSAANDQNQFLMLKLDKMALIESIGFGKFHKGKKGNNAKVPKSIILPYYQLQSLFLSFCLVVHVCNLKEFKIYAGPSVDNLHLILHTGLNNDTVPESFPPDYSLSGLPDSLPFPVLFLKIVPLAAWGSNFNFSIWYVEIKGWDSTGSAAGVDLVKAALDEYNRTREIETTRLILKFLRQHSHKEALLALQASSGVQLEAPEVTQLHSLITHRQFQEAESLLLAMYAKDPTIFDQYLHESVPYKVQWTRL